MANEETCLVYKASRILISEREKFSKLTVCLVSVRRLPIAEPQQCYMNANNAVSIDVLGSGSTKNPVVGGWLAHKYQPAYKLSEFVQHWWNWDPLSKSYFDTTPLSSDVESWGYEYILDDEIVQTSATRYHELKYPVGKDISLVEGRWVWTEISDDRSEVKQQPLESLRIENLMYFA